MNENAQAAIHSYVTDMLALEHRGKSALESQLKGAAETSAFRPSLERMLHLRQVHIEALTALSERREIGGQGISEVVKKAAASVLGMGAAIVDLVRTEDVPKDLRDDYTVMSLNCVGYMMLYTTALALGDDEVATLAKKHYADDAKTVMSLQDIIPEAVLVFLSDDGLSPRVDVLPEIHRSVRAAWTSETHDTDSHPTPSHPFATQGI